MRSAASRRISWLLTVIIFLAFLLGQFPSQAVSAAPVYQDEDPIAEIPPEINKKFVPIAIPPGGISRLTVEIFNPNDYPLSSLAFVDQLEKIQPGIEIAANPQAASTCGGTVSAVAGSNILSLSGGTVGPKVNSTDGSCRVSVNVTSFVPGNLDNVFVPGDLTGQYQPPEGELILLANTGDTVETLNVATLAAARVTKSFTPSTVYVGSRTRLRISIQNRDTAYPLHQVNLTDTLPAGVIVATPPGVLIGPNCGTAAVNAPVGADTVGISGAVIPANTSCYFDVYVTAADSDTYVNTIPANAVTSFEGVTNSNSPSATLTVNGLQISKSFNRTSILAGEQTATLTLTVRNPVPQALTNASLTDVLPGSDLVYVPGTASTTCQVGGSPATLTLSNGNQTLALTSGTIPAGTVSSGVVTPGTCTITVTVTAPGNAAGGTYINEIPSGALGNDQNVTNPDPASDDLTVTPQSIGVAKSFKPSRFELGGQTYAVITLSNPTSIAIPNVNLTDDLPVGLVTISPADVSSTCGGTVTAGATSFTLTNGTIPANGSCSFQVLITTAPGASASTFVNTIPANAITGAGITNLDGGQGSIPVYPVNQGVVASKSFADNNQPQPTGTPIQMTLTFRAPEDQTLTNVSISDTLPSGLFVLGSPAPSISGCGTGSVLSAVPNATQISLTGGTIQAGATCTIRVTVTGSLPAGYTNTISPAEFSSAEGQTFPNPVSDTLNLSDYTLQKSFSPAKIDVGGRSIITITLVNENTTPMVNVWLQDRLNTMGSGEFVIAGDPAPTTTCGGTLTAPVGGNIVTLSGGSIPGRSGSTNGTCVVKVTILANGSANTSNNTIARTDTTAELQGTGNPVPPRGSVSAPITVADLNIDLVKNFDPSFVSGGSTSHMTILLINRNDVPMEDISFTDGMPARMKASQPFNIDTSTCGGDVVVAPDRQSFTYSGGYLAAGRRCEISINVTIRINGNLVNTIPANAVTTFNGATNNFPASSTLTNLPGVSVSKYFTPNRMLAEPGKYVLMTIGLTNTSNAPIPDLGLQDNFPSGLVIANAPDDPPTNTCGGTLTADVGAGSLTLANGYLAGVADPDDPQPEECFLTVPVTSSAIGKYRNVIEEGDVTSSVPTITNADPAEDTLEVYGTPDMQIVKSVTSTGPYIEGDTITYDIIVTNTGDITLTNVQVTDAGLGAVLGACNPVLGSSLAPAATMICAASYQVTAADITNGEYVNTAVASSDQAGPVEDQETVPLEGGPEINIKKTITSQGPYGLGDTISYAIKVTNTGTITLNNVQVTELTPGVVLGTCSPVLGSSLSVGEIMTCPASVQVNQAMVDAGTFTNTAQADSDEVDPETDSVTTTITRSPSLAVYKFETSSGPYAVNDRITFDIVTENTGDTTLTNVTVTDTGTELPLGDCTLNETTAVVPLPTSLNPGDILYCEAYHDVTQGNIDAGVYSNTAVVDSAETPPGTGEAEVPMVQIQIVEIEKTGTLNTDVVEPDDRVDVGDTVTYTFTVRNNGNVTLHNLTIDDVVVDVVITGGPIVSLAPGASDSTTFTGVYSLKQVDVDAGSFDNKATVTAYDPQDRVVRDDDVDEQTFDQSASISLEKLGTLNLAVVAPDEEANVGDEISYSFSVTNTGNVTLTNVTVVDDADGVVVSGGPLLSLLPGETDSTTFTGVYELTQDDIDAGTYTNTAIGKGTDPDNTDVDDSDDDTQTLTAAPNIELDKYGTIDDTVVAPSGVVNVGDRINYAFTVRNTGNVTLTNISVTDVLSGVTITGNPIASLLPGAEDSTTIKGVYTLTQADIDAGTFVNNASVTGSTPGGGTVTDPATDTQTLTPAPAITVSKVATIVDDIVPPAGVVNVGDRVTYTFTITNIGNVTLDNVTVTENTAGVTLVGDPIPSLAPGASNSTAYTASYTLTQVDVDAGTFSNIATVTGTPPAGDPVTDQDTEESNFSAQPSIDLVKDGLVFANVVPPDGEVNEGDQVRYTFRIENTGNVTLTNVVVADTNPLVILSGCIIAELAPGEVNDTSCTGTYTLTQTDIDSGSFSNLAEVTAEDPNGTEVDDQSEVTKDLEDAGRLGVAKALTSGPSQVAPGVWQVTFTLRMVNMGNVTLSNLQLEDDLSVVFPDPNVFVVLDLTSPDFTVNWPGYDGDGTGGGDITLLADGANALEVGESGTITLLVELIPVNGGPFYNQAFGSAENPQGDGVEDLSQNGEDPDPDGDGVPENNNDPTLIDFGKNLFNRPIGLKTYNNAGLPVLDWQVTWINSTNIVPVYVRMSDPITAGTRFVNTGVPSGYDLPAGDLPTGSTTSGVACRRGDGQAATKTTTKYCYYEGPTTAFPRGRVIWEGTLGPDFGAALASEAENEINILYSTLVSGTTNEVENVADLDVDKDGDGGFSEDEKTATTVTEIWRAATLPQTGFAPGMITHLPGQPLDLLYRPSEMVIEIPDLNVTATIVTVPFADGSWDVTWLGNQVGYLEGSAYPTWEGNTVLTAHNTTPYDQPGLFADLKSLSYGDQIIIRAFGQTFTYEVRERQTVLDGNTTAAFREESYDWLTLMTCDGFNPERGVYAFRQLVRAVLISVK